MIKVKSYLKKGDTIKIISGKNKGTISEIIKVLRDQNQVVVRGVNIKKKHTKPKKQGEVGSIIQFEVPINSSKVMLYSPEKKVASRICIQTGLDGKKVRVLKKLLQN
jgi:large subunit ribosomal protein L24